MVSFGVLNTFLAFLAFLGLWRTFELKKRINELKWCHDMSGEHTGPGRPIASGEEPLHLPGGS
jgi:hypothetical protein